MSFTSLLASTTRENIEAGIDGVPRLTNDRGGHGKLLVDEPILVQVVQVPDVVLADEMLLPPAPFPHSLQSHLGISLRRSW